MVHLQAGTALRHIRSLIARHGSFPETDQQLLHRFITRTEEDAFAALVRRHGPLVLRVCRDVLHEEHAAEDAFQATFLVLARKASSIRARDSLGGWLRGVAQRVALKARVRGSRFPQCSAIPEVGVAVDPLANMTVCEARALLHEELQRLPAKYREPLCLCYLEGKTRDEAAQLLQWPLGTFNSRIDRARELLRGRLTQRGLSLSAVLLTTLLTGRSAAALSTALAEVTVRAAVGFATDQAISDVASAKAVMLAQGMLPAAMSKSKVLAALLTVGLLGTAFGVATQVATAEKDNGAARDDRPGAAAAPAPLVDCYGDPLPENALARIGTLRGRQADTFFVACLPDGKSSITASRDGSIRSWDNETGKELRRFTEASGPAGFNPIFGGLAGSPLAVALSPDGKLLARVRTPGFGLLGGMGGPGLPPAEDDDEKPKKDAKPAEDETKPVDMTSSIRMWDVASGKEIASRMKCEPGAITALTFSPDSKTLAVGYGSGFVHVYDVGTGRERAKVGRAAEKQKINNMEIVLPADLSIVFSRDGNSLLVVEFVIGDNKISHAARIWDLKTRKEIRQLKLPDVSSFRVGVSPDGKTLAWAQAGDDAIVLWSTEQDKELRRLEVGRELASAHLTFSNDGKRLAARLPDGSIRLWDVATGKETANLATERQAPEDGMMLQVFIQRHVDLAFSADDKVLVSAGRDSTIRVWDLTTNKERGQTVGHQGAVTTLALSTDGKVLSTRGGDGTVRQWDAATGRQLRAVRLMAGAAAGTFSSNGRRFAFAGPEKAVYLWDVATGKELWKADGKVRTTDLALSPDDKILATLGTGHVIQLWDSATGKALRSMQKGDSPAADFIAAIQPDTVGLMFSPDGRLLASAENKGNPMVIINGEQTPGDDPAIYVWNPATGKLIRKLEMEGAVAGFQGWSSAMAFSPDSRMLAAAVLGRICVWELATGKKRLEIQDVTTPTVLTWSPDCKTLAMGTADRTIQFRDLVSGKHLGEFSGHGGTIGALAFAADGRTIFSGSSDTTALVWSMSGAKKAEAPEITSPTEKELEAMWANLRDGDASKAWKAANTLSNATPALALLRDRLRPVAPAKPERLAELVAALGGARFEERRQAAEQLEALGDMAVPVLQKALDDKPALEMRQRIDSILGTILDKQLLSPEQLQALRALEVLEWIGTAQAAQVLEGLSKGAPAARLTREAQATLDRLKKQLPSKAAPSTNGEGK